MKTGKSLAYGMIVCRSIIYGTSILFTGTLLRTVSVMDVLALRFLISAAAFLLLALTGIIHVDFRKKPLKIIAAAALFEPVGYFLLETLGLRSTSTSLAGIISAMTPVTVVLLETVILRERTSWLQKILLLVSIAGVTLVTVCTGSDAGGSNSLWGILLLIGAYISGALFLICSRKSSQAFSSVEITFFTTMVGAVVFNGINVVRHAMAGTIATYFSPLFSAENLVGFLFLSLLSSIAATVMNNYALSRIQASCVSALSGISTITSIAAGVLVNHEVLHWYHLVGAVLILVGGIGVNYLAQKRIEQEKEPLTV